MPAQPLISHYWPCKRAVLGTPNAWWHAMSHIPSATYHSSDWSELPQPTYITNTPVGFQLHQHPIQLDSVNMKMEAVCSSKILWPTFNYLVWKTQKWLPYKTVSIQVMKAQLHTFLTAVLNGTISFMTQGFILGMHLIGDWVGPKTGLDSLDKRKILFISHELNHDLSEASPLHFIWSI